MKKFYLVLAFLLTSLLSFGQEFTQPDSSAIRKSKVKSVKIFYSGTGNKHSITQEYHYDKLGRCVYSREGFAGYYYTFTYNSKSQEAAWYQRSNTGSLIQGYVKDYYPNGKLFHMQSFSDRDTLRPYSIFTFDTIGNKIEENYFNEGKLIRSMKNDYDTNNKIINQIDSTPGKTVYEIRNYKTVRQTHLNDKSEVTESWLIQYSDKGRLASTICIKGDKKTNYKVDYDANDGSYKVVKNGFQIGKEELVEWDRKFNWLIPRPREGEMDNRLPYADPVPTYDYKHEISRDKQGNILQDKVTAAYPYMIADPIQFDYEYEYW